MNSQFFIYKTHKVSSCVLKIIGVFLVIALCLSQATLALAESGKAKKKATAPVTVARRVTGEVGVVRFNYITVIYKKETKRDGGIKDYEMLLPIDDNTKLVHRRSLDQIQEGDTIEITYDETGWVDKKGIGRLERKARQIRFIRAAIKGLRSQ